MKNNRLKWIFFCLCVMCIFTAAAFAEPVQEGDRLSPLLELASNPTTGYSWSVSCEPEGVVKVSELEFDGADDGLIGAGGTQRFRLCGLQAGGAVVTLTYGRSWEEQSLYRIRCSVHVDEESNVFIESTAFSVD